MEVSDGVDTDRGLTRDEWIVPVFICLTVVIAVARLYYPTRGLGTFSLMGSYEAVAHIVVGMLFGAWLVTWRRLYLCLFLAITAVEVVAFAVK